VLQSEVLIEGLLQNGRLTFDQLVECTISKVPESTSFLNFILNFLCNRPMCFYCIVLIPSLA
jgi:hypothetical protein